ncbi:DNA mismatch repair endonuclease MutL [Tepidibacillus fermentans]|uniref:DNA mismatch repair protein MutL n=1 Tax=Tepidibacillus fermentans TaxID=1281767 RepID=A0A4R3KI05_9BACI|nr:DNA mismatch repair endonuclease MutL [Tepidibacillus fermentans]TCS83038.1 DNA mismatch repair protein MutL [Tepidibacillus fermentans]
MGKIRILDDHIANQIAAGEVVERPASVVKELVENSIDAGSTKIEIQIEDGGLSLIQIRDNGEGMDEEDVEKAFYRHATSKLQRGNDLFRIKTLGFRGEALPSIAAVSRLKIKTSPNHDGKGLELHLQGGSVVNKQEIAYTKGTEITVRDLFFNTPARLKYMKSLQTELGHITDYVNRLSLAYPMIAFTLIHNGRLILRTAGDGQIRHVIGAIYGTSLAKNMVSFLNENTDFKISGLLSKPDITRANKNHISIFVNGRYIKHFALTQAIIDGYKTLLMVHRYPITTLHIELDPSLIDVNVHPAKLEVRFSKEQELLKFVETTVYQALHQESFIREPLKTNQGKAVVKKSFQDTLDYSFSFSKPNKPQQTVKEREIISTFSNLKDDLPPFSQKINEMNELEQPIPLEENSLKDTMKERLPILEPITQFLGTYIIAQNEDGLYLIDQHAAHERINYEKNLRQMNEEKQSSQELLIPFIFDFTRLEIDELLKHKEYFKEHGLEFDLFGTQTILIRSIPSWIPKGQETIYLEKMMLMVLQKGRIDFSILRQEMVASISCKASIKANQYLTKTEMEQLLEQLRNTENPFSCPHGRPIIIHFSTYEIEKMFKRVI